MKNKLKRGFTLIELLLGIAIISILSVVLTTLIIRYGILYERQQIDVAANLDNRFILDDIATRAREAAEVSNSLIVGSDTFTTNSTTIILKVPSLDQNGQNISTVFDYVIYYKDATSPDTLRKKVVPDAQSTRQSSSQLLTSALKSITFSYNNADPQMASVITVVLETVKTESGQTKEARDTIQVTLRNL